jgi:hypothetical protein
MMNQHLVEDHLDDRGGNNRIDEVLSNIQPLRDLAKNWDIDIASWYVMIVVLSRRFNSMDLEE